MTFSFLNRFYRGIFGVSTLFLCVFYSGVMAQEIELPYRNIAMNSTQTGTVTENDHLHGYILDLTSQNSVLVISARAQNNDTDIDLAVNYQIPLREDMNESDLDFQDLGVNNNPRYILMNPPLGRYYIYVFDTIDPQASYSLKVSNLVNDSLNNNSCQWAFDGECDDPLTGTGACALNTDSHDCSGGEPIAATCWKSYTNDQRQFSTQPGNVYPHDTLAVGNYYLLVGPSGSGNPAVPSNFTSFGPYALLGEHKYNVGLQNSPTIIFEVNSAATVMYPAYANNATVFVHNYNTSEFMSLCLVATQDPAIR